MDFGCENIPVGNTRSDTVAWSSAVSTISPAQFRKRHSAVLVNAKSEALIYDVSDSKDRNNNLTGAIPRRTCYAAHAGARGWCATCKIAGDSDGDGDIDDNEFCVEERVEPLRPMADKGWSVIETGFTVIKLCLRTKSVVLSQGLVQQAVRRGPRAAPSPPAGGHPGRLPAGQVRQDAGGHAGALRPGEGDLRRVHLQEEEEGIPHEVRRAN